ncbi:DUF3617 domain-containing protein [Rhodanobacter sp. FW106-PBR-LB-2-11]|uniref:DUF3617 domain-containing protein n=1 Tax=Rhodanobacter sp. FW106-PBR-LB-2-11 TaxID=1524463 RepID=UPI0034E3FF01
MHTRLLYVAIMAATTVLFTGCNSHTPPGSARARASGGAPDLTRKGLWEYAGKVNVAIEGKPIASLPRQWQLCLETDGEPPMIKPEGQAITKCTAPVAKPTATGYHATMSCVTTDDGTDHALSESLDVTTGKDGRTVTLDGNISTTLSDDATRPQPMTMQITASGHWAGECR